MRTPGGLEFTVILFYLILIIITLMALRWLFAIGRRLKQNESTINLLKLIAKKQGATDDEIHNAIQQS